MSTGAGRGRIFGLDLLRAAAIGLVLTTHANAFFFRALLPRRLGDLADAGNVGVDVFFVLSGFLIGGILRRDLDADPSARALVRFWSRRWWRTLPNYFLFLAFNLAAAVWITGWRPRALPYAAFAQGLLHKPPDLFPESWSLCVEEWFYLLFGASAFALASLARRGRGRGYLPAAALVAGASLIVRAVLVLGLDRPMDDIRHATLPRLATLMFGVVAADLAARGPARWRAAAVPAGLAGLALLAAGLALHLAVPAEGVFMRLAYDDVFALGTALLLPALSSWREWRHPASAVVSGASLYSYSIYLVNFPLGRAVRAVLGPPAGAAGAVGSAATWLVATIGLAALCYHLYESRMTRLREVDWIGLASRGRAGRPAPGAGAVLRSGSGPRTGAGSRRGRSRSRP